MPFHQEATFHDRQAVSSTVLQDTSNTDFVDINGATITAKQLGSVGAYLGWASLLMSNTNNNTTAFFRITLNGTPLGDITSVILRAKDFDIGYTITGDLNGLDIVGGDVIQLQYATSSGTLSLVEYSLLIDGVPSSRVV